MKIAVNTRLLIKNKLEGIGWFTYETLRRLTEAMPEAQFYFLFDRDPHPDFLFGKNVTPVVIGPQARHPFLFLAWFEYSVPRALQRIRPDVFLSPDGYLSLRTSVPQLAVMHDLNFEHFPEDLPFLVRKYYRIFFPRFAAKAKRIATVSEFSKGDIVDSYGIDPGRIDVVYNGANEMFVPLASAAADEVRKQYTGGRPYFYFVGSLHPRKNLARLFTAYGRFREKTGEETVLLIVGEKKWWTAEIRGAYEANPFREDILFTGRLEPEDLCKVTASALASVYVSYFEGFGIPIVEAFRCGVPVITAAATATQEVAGDAALCVDPFDTDAIAGAMERVAGDAHLRDTLSRKGKERAREFTWDKTAARLKSSLLRTLGDN